MADNATCFTWRELTVTLENTMWNTFTNLLGIFDVTNAGFR